MEAALTLPPTNVVVAVRRSARSDVTLRSHRKSRRPLDVVAATFSILSHLRHLRPTLRA